MIRGMYSAISGLRTHQVMLDVVSNNLAPPHGHGAETNGVALTAAGQFEQQTVQALFYRAEG